MLTGIASAAPLTSLSPLQQKVLSAPLQKPYQWFASTDPKAQNQDYLLLNPGETRQIPLAAGSLLRLWCTALAPDQISLSLKNNGTIPLLNNGKASAGTFYQKAYTLYAQDTTNAALQILDASAGLTVVNHSKEKNKFFYQASVRPLPLVAAPPYSGRELLINALKKISAGQNMTIGEPGQLKSGVIREIRISSLDATQLPLNDLILQVTPGQDTPIVQVPLSAFLGEFEHLFPGSTGLSHWDGKTLVIDWPMPTGSDNDNELSLKIQNAGQASCFVKVQLSFLQMDKPPAYLFCARQGSANSVEGQPFALAIIDGSGALMGISADMGPQPDSARRTFAFLEGNETINADTNKFEGTGTEDFFNSAWYFPKQPYLHPYDGMNWHSDAPPRVAASRWMIEDAIPFHKQLTVDLEHGNGNHGTDLQYHWYAFWYQQQPVRFEIPEILHAADLDLPRAPANIPGDSLVFALLRVVLYTAFFAAFIFVILVALAKYGQRK